MTTPHKAMLQQALEALQTVMADVNTTPNAYEAQRQAIAALQAAIDAPEPEPIGYAYEHQDFIGSVIGAKGDWAPDEIALYTNPPVREPLSDAEIDDAIQQHVDPVATYPKLVAFARAIEAAHGIKS